MEITSKLHPKTPFLYTRQKMFLITLFIIFLISICLFSALWIFSLNKTLVMSLSESQVHLKTGFEYGLPRIFWGIVISILVSWGILFLCSFIFLKKQLFPHKILISLLSPDCSLPKQTELLDSLQAFPDVHSEISHFIDKKMNKELCFKNDISSLQTHLSQLDRYFNQITPHLSEEDSTLLKQTLSEAQEQLLLIKHPLSS